MSGRVYASSFYLDPEKSYYFVFEVLRKDAPLGVPDYIHWFRDIGMSKFKTLKIATYSVDIMWSYANYLVTHVYVETNKFKARVNGFERRPILNTEIYAAREVAVWRELPWEERTP